MNIDPKFEKAWKYANNFMLKAIKNEGHLTVFLKAEDVKKEWSEEEIRFLKDAWYVVTTGKCSPDSMSQELDAVEERVEEVIEEKTGEDISVPDFDAMTKREIDDWALGLGIELDRRKSKKNMLKELEEKLAE